MNNTSDVKDDIKNINNYLIIVIILISFLIIICGVIFFHRGNSGNSTLPDISMHQTGDKFYFENNYSNCGLSIYDNITHHLVIKNTGFVNSIKDYGGKIYFTTANKKMIVKFIVIMKSLVK